MGHFDLDPHPDVVAFHQTGVTTTATLLHGAGDGTFERHLAFPVPLGIHASHIVAADVNGDGVDDLVIADHGMGVATVLSDGANGWSLPLLLNLVASPNSILSLVTADVDRDGDQDAIVLQSGGLVTVLDNDGTGSLAIASDFQVETLAQEIIVDDRHGPEYVAVFDRAPAAHVSIYPRDNQSSFEDSTMFAVDVQEGLDYCLAMVPVRSNIFRMPRVVVLAGNIQTGEIKAFLIRADSPSDPAVELDVPQGTPWRIAAGDLNLDLNEDLALFCVWQEGSGATATPHLAIETLLSTGQ